jgi:hypothetical protein
VSQTASERDLWKAVGKFLWSDPGHIMLMASHLRDAHQYIECGMGGASMGTAVPIDSRIRIQFSHDQSYPLGTVIAFLVGTRVMVHRVMYRGRRRRTRDFILTLGDRVWLPDSPVDVNSILGSVVEYQHHGVILPPGPAPHWTSRGRLASLFIVRIMAVALELDVALSSTIRRLLRKSADRKFSIRAFGSSLPKFW